MSIKEIRLFILFSLVFGLLLTFFVAFGSEEPRPAAFPTATAIAVLNTLPPTYTAVYLEEYATFTAIPLATETATNTPTPTNTAIPSSTPTLLPTATATNTPIPTFTATPELLPTPNGIYSRTVRVPILMYHYISTPPEDADVYRTDLSMEPAMFEQQMAYLAENGYTPIDLYTLSLAITNKAELPEKPVILTFDDGYIDAYQNAFPILEAYGFKGTFFIITEYVDKANPNHMSWPMIEQMSAAGHRMESHTKTHLDLSKLTWDGQIYQILGSLETLEAHIGYRPRYLCYPAGRYNEDSMAIAEQLGLWGAVTTRGGKWHGFDNRFEWRRVRMRYDTTMEEFIEALEP
jgi:peptidoglycan/xylan/chitin deacetylase (PgdA/CDA1 family)